MLAVTDRRWHKIGYVRRRRSKFHEAVLWRCSCHVCCCILEEGLHSSSIRRNVLKTNIEVRNSSWDRYYIVSKERSSRVFLDCAYSHLLGTRSRSSGAVPWQKIWIPAAALEKKSWLKLCTRHKYQHWTLASSNNIGRFIAPFENHHCHPITWGGSLEVILGLTSW